MKKIGFIILFLCFFGNILSETLVSNVFAHQEGQNIVIEYDLARQNDITAYVNIDGSYVKLNNVTGDIGDKITAGHKRIVWDVLSQYEKFEYSNVLFKIDIGITSVTDICGNTYPVVKIGNQYWMAENMRCDKYDLESEAYIEGRTKVLTSEYEKNTPYYTDATNLERWDTNSKTTYGVKLLKLKKVFKLGCLYNWAAVVGISDGETISKAFDDRRQGICPNGWHVPTIKEWNELQSYIEEIQKRGPGHAGMHLKSSLCWYNNGDGTDIYNFSAFPAGCSYGKSVELVGDAAFFWTASTNKVRSAQYIYMNHGFDYLENEEVYKAVGYSVRCVKNQ